MIHHLYGICERQDTRNADLAGLAGGQDLYLHNNRGRMRSRNLRFQGKRDAGSGTRGLGGGVYERSHRARAISVQIVPGIVIASGDESQPVAGQPQAPHIGEAVNLRLPSYPN